MICFVGGFSIAFAFGFKESGIHSMMSFLLIGIGGDDMFVIANAIDQTSFHLSYHERFKIGLAHAGPSVSITTFTNALAFYFGTFTPIPALSDFCVFACFCVMVLYGAVLTVFLSIIAWDTKRIRERKGECCGMCCCKEDSWICCNGRFLSVKQKEYSGIEITDKDHKGPSVADYEAKTPATPMTINEEDESPSPVKTR
jgi:predicted RND superfamily exporter protein